MKKLMCLLLAVVINSCTNEIEIEPIKYSEKDVIPLSDSVKRLYYDDAAYVEFGNVIKDSLNRIAQVKLNENTIVSYYEDLLYIYNNSFKLGNSFFEYASTLHSFGALTLYGITVAFDSNKSWTSNWKGGIKYTGLIKIDSLIDNYNLGIYFGWKFEGTYWFEIKSEAPINYFALIEKFEATSEFIYVEPFVLVGGGSVISLKAEDDYKYFIYHYGWGDCPLGCINYHYWVVGLKDKELILYEEGGNSLN
jgi:hypothetical protein